jgi:hypothetical protein
VKRDWMYLRKYGERGPRQSKPLVFGHCNFTHLVETADEETAIAESKGPFLRALGTRAWEQLRQCYMVGSIDQITARIADLVAAGLEYLVLGPVTDDPKQIDLLAKYILPAFDRYA